MPKTDVHVLIEEYHQEYFADNGYNLSEVIRQELDGRMMSDGADPENWRESVEGNGESTTPP